jgi:Spy/CpxP family protein refolding chaperone
VKTKKQNKILEEEMKPKVVIIALLLIFLGSLAQAQFFGPRFKGVPDDGIPQWWNRAKIVEELKLTDEQKSKLESLSFEFRKSQAELIGKLSKARIELQELLSAERPDKSAIDKKANEIAGYVSELTKLRINHWLSVQQVLTPEQRKILKEKFYWGLGLGRRGKPGFGLRLHRCW